MTDGYDQALVNGGLALLTADVLLVVYPGGVPQPVPPAPPIPPPYVVVYSTVEWSFSAGCDSLDGLSGTPTVRWITHSVGGGVPGCTPAAADQAARAVGQRVRTALLNKRLVIAGMDCGLIRQESGGGVPQPVYQTGDPVMDLISTYRTFATT
jgi:hypothetical protein